MTGEGNPVRQTDVSTPVPGRHAALCWLLLAAILASAVALRSAVAAGTDVSWLLTVCDKILGGQRLYTDIIETNPPIAVWTYMPGVLIARALHLRAEAVTDALVFLGAAVSMGIAAIMLRRSSAFAGRNNWPLVLVGAAVVLLLPMQSFGQREHIAFLAFLPALAGYILRSEGKDLPLWQILVAGLAAGVTLAFKPYYLLAMGAAILIAAFHARALRVLFAPENIIAAGIAGISTLAIYALYPAYFTMIYPLLRDVYLPLKQPLLELVRSNGMLIWAGALTVTLLSIRKGRPDAVTSVLLAASAGFACAYILQHKGWPYQSYSMLAVALMALMYELTGRSGDTRRASRKSGLVCLAGLLLGAILWMNDASNAQILEPAVRQFGPHPKILALTAEPSIGFPLTRSVGGEWVSRQQALWVRDAVKRIKAGEYGHVPTDGLDAYVARERAWLIEDIKRTPPTVILVDNLLSDWGAWAKSDPFFADFLKNYRLVDTIQHINVLALRNDAVPAAPQR